MRQPPVCLENRFNSGFHTHVHFNRGCTWRPAHGRVRGVSTQPYRREAAGKKVEILSPEMRDFGVPFATYMFNVDTHEVIELS